MKKFSELKTPLDFLNLTELERSFYKLHKTLPSYYISNNHVGEFVGEQAMQTPADSQVFHLEWKEGGK